MRRENDVEIVMEEMPVGDHQAHGLEENAVKNIQGQFRVIKDALESRHGGRVDGEHPVVPWRAGSGARSSTEKQGRGSDGDVFRR